MMFLDVLFGDLDDVRWTLDLMPLAPHSFERVGDLSRLGTQLCSRRLRHHHVPPASGWAHALLRVGTWWRQSARRMTGLVGLVRAISTKPARRKSAFVPV